MCDNCTLLASILPIILDFDRLCILFGGDKLINVCLCPKSKHMHYIIFLAVIAIPMFLFVNALYNEGKKNNI